MRRALPIAAIACVLALVSAGILWSIGRDDAAARSRSSAATASSGPAEAADRAGATVEPSPAMRTDAANAATKGFIMGRVEDVAGAPIALARVELTLQGSESLAVAAQTEEEGTFRFESVEPTASF